MFQGKKKSPDIIAFIISIFIELATFRDRGGSVDTWIKKMMFSDAPLNQFKGLIAFCF